VPVLVIPTDEEQEIARQTLALLASAPPATDDPASARP
jgi:hypothetical protein